MSTKRRDPQRSLTSCVRPCKKDKRFRREKCKVGQSYPWIEDKPAPPNSKFFVPPTNVDDLQGSDFSGYSTANSDHDEDGSSENSEGKVEEQRANDGAAAGGGKKPAAAAAAATDLLVVHDLPILGDQRGYLGVLKQEQAAPFACGPPARLKAWPKKNLKLMCKVCSKKGWGSDKCPRFLASVNPSANKRLQELIAEEGGGE